MRGSHSLGLARSVPRQPIIERATAGQCWVRSNCEDDVARGNNELSK